MGGVSSGAAGERGHACSFRSELTDVGVEEVHIVPVSHDLARQGGVVGHQPHVGRVGKGVLKGE